MRRRSTQPTSTSTSPQSPGLLNVHVTFKGTQSSEREGSVRFADEEDKSLAV